jgi:uncharacterized phage protein gp47/JayE
VLVKGTFDSDELAEAIYTHRGAGTGTVGDTTVSYTDSDSGDTVDLKYTEADDITIDVEITLDIFDNTTYTADGGADAIKTAVAAYINSLAMGVDVDRSRIYTPANTVGGHTITSVKLSRNPAAVTAADITLDVDEYAVTAVGNITVA